MKKLIVILAALLSGCASYADLDAQCATGSKIACNEMASRDSWVSAIGSGLAYSIEQNEQNERRNRELAQSNAIANQLANINQTMQIQNSQLAQQEFIRNLHRN